MARKQIRFSIIIPTYSRQRELLSCLESLARLDYPQDKYEVIVIDDGSETPPGDVVASFRCRLNVTLLTQSNAGPATARNFGASKARAEFLAFTDDDCAPASNWLKRLASRFEKTPECAIGGQTLNALQVNLYSAASQLLVDYLYGYYNIKPRQAHFLATNNLALPADLFHAIGGFDTTFSRAAGEDREFCARWLHHGYRLIYAPEAKVFHSHKLDFPSFLRQHYNYGHAALYFHKKCLERYQRSIRPQPLSFYVKMLLYPFSQIGMPKKPFMATLLAVSQVSNALGLICAYLMTPSGKNDERNRS